MKVLFLIRSLDAGGAERQLIELVKHLDPSVCEPLVVTFYDGGLLCDEIKDEDHIKLFSLHKTGRWDFWGFFRQLSSLVALEKPDVIHGYLDVANLFALLVGKIHHSKVVWGLRASIIDMKKYDWTAGFVFRLAALLSGLADCIIVNSEAGYRHHVQQGFSSKKMLVIHNGIDTDKFYPDAPAGVNKRKEWGLSEGDLVIGQVGRLDLMKAPGLFIEAAALIVRQFPQTHFVYVGDGPTAYKTELLAQVDRLGLSSHFLWAGLQKDMRAVYNALDLLSLSSDAEGFPNVVGEAMACGIPCVVTNVGDAAFVVDQAGIVVPPRDPQALADGLISLIVQSPQNRQVLGKTARKRIITSFSDRLLVETTLKTIQNIIKTGKVNPTV